MSNENKIIPRDSIILNVSPDQLPATDLNCCIGKINPKLLSFSIRVFISIMVLSFSMYKLWLKPSCDCDNDNVVYVSLITSILSIWLGSAVK